ncbi:flavodoxin [Alistipes sp. cv1]|nr:flavodoxin [Faecalibacterium prausnitzii]
MAKAEKEADARPAIKSKVDNWDQYDTVFIGCPVWWWTAPMIINTFAESYDFRGKTVVPFCTYAATYRDETLARIRELTPAAEHLKGFGTNKRSGKLVADDQCHTIVRRIVLKTTGLAVVVRTIASSFRIYFYFCI